MNHYAKRETELPLWKRVASWLGLLFLLALMVFFFWAPMHAQERSNTYYAAQFAGADVGAKITAAQAQCSPNTAIPCIIVFDAILAGWPQGTLPAPCSQCIWIDYRTAATVQYAATYAKSSSTCGIAEAYNALPANGGKIILQLGNCSASGWPVTIQKPVVIEGQGMGGPNDAGTNANLIAGSSLTNTSTGSSFFVISIGAGNSVEGVSFRNFAMIGNKTVVGSTAGDCVDINGGSTAQQVRALSFENVQCNQPKGSGFVIQDNAFIITFFNVHTLQSGSHCYVLKNGTQSGVNSQIRFIASVGDLCGGNNASINPGTADVWNISGSTARDLEITDSTLADSNNGISVVAGAINSTINVSGSNLESNTTCDISLNDGFGHTIFGSTFRGDNVGARGVCTAMPVGASTALSQLIMLGNVLTAHTVQDITIGANQKTGFILPQATNNYTYSDASGNVVKLDVTTFGGLTFTGGGNGFAPTVNGSYQLGNATNAWSLVSTFSNQISEFTAPAAAAGKDICYGDSTAHAIKCSYNNGVFFATPQVIASGTATMTTALIGAGACGTTVTVAATGVVTTDTITWDFNSAPLANPGVLVVSAWPTAGNVNFQYCNPTTAGVTPTAAALNWRVVR